MAKALVGRARRKRRIRSRVEGTADRPRLSVFRSARHIYAQVIDDLQGKTLAAASTKTKDFGGSGSKSEIAKSVGEAIAKACKAQGVEKIVFDRNGYLYHGRVRALAEGAREAGLQF